MTMSETITPRGTTFVPPSTNQAIEAIRADAPIAPAMRFASGRLKYVSSVRNWPRNARATSLRGRSQTKDFQNRVQNSGATWKSKRSKSAIISDRNRIAEYAARRTTRRPKELRRL